jgi:hypothetical protein
MGTADEELMAARPLELTLYSRARCHLCEEMHASLQMMQRRHSFTIAVVDVDGDPALAARFDTEVPVLAHGTHELCRHRIDVPRVDAYLSGVRQVQSGPHAAG